MCSQLKPISAAGAAPHAGVIGAALDWIFEIAKLRAAKPQAIATGLREAAERNYVGFGLTRRAPDKMNIPGF